MKKVLIVATVQSHVAQFHKEFINILKKNGYIVEVAARNNLKEKNGLSLVEPNKIYDIPFSRSPFGKSNFKAYKMLKEIIKTNSYDVIHCHTPMGGVLTRLAAKNVNAKSKVFYTAHGFHFYKGASLKNWLMYYPVEKKLSKYTDIIFTINQEDFEIANKKFKCKKVIKTDGVGFNKVRLHCEKKIELDEFFPTIALPFIITVIGELNDNKNQKYIINNLNDIIKANPNIAIMLVGNGPNQEKLQKTIDKRKLTQNVKLFGYRSDISSLLDVTNVVISASKREGLPNNIIEAMYKGKIILASEIRGHKDLIKNGENGFLFDLKSTDDFKKKFIDIYQNYSLMDFIRIKAKETSKKYEDHIVNLEMLKIYNDVRNDLI